MSTHYDWNYHSSLHMVQDQITSVALQTYWLPPCCFHSAPISKQEFTSRLPWSSTAQSKHQICPSLIRSRSRRSTDTSCYVHLSVYVQNMVQNVYEMKRFTSCWRRSSSAALHRGRAWIRVGPWTSRGSTQETFWGPCFAVDRHIHWVRHYMQLWPLF